MARVRTLSCPIFRGLCGVLLRLLFFFFKQKTAYEMRISDWSSDVCSSDLQRQGIGGRTAPDDGEEEQRCDDEVAHQHDRQRLEESRVGQERVSTCRCRW